MIQICTKCNMLFENKKNSIREKCYWCEPNEKIIIDIKSGYLKKYLEKSKQKIDRIIEDNFHDLYKGEIKDLRKQNRLLEHENIQLRNENNELRNKISNLLSGLEKLGKFTR